MCGFIHIALVRDMVKTQAGSNTSKQVWHRQDKLNPEGEANG